MACCLGYSGVPVKAQTKDSTNTLSDTVNLLSESSYLFIHWLASGKAAFVSVTRIVEKNDLSVYRQWPLFALHIYWVMILTRVVNRVGAFFFCPFTL